MGVDLHSPSRVREALDVSRRKVDIQPDTARLYHDRHAVGRSFTTPCAMEIWNLGFLWTSELDSHIHLIEIETARRPDLEGMKAIVAIGPLGCTEIVEVLARVDIVD